MIAHVWSAVERVIELTLPKREQNCANALFSIDIGMLRMMTRLILRGAISEYMLNFNETENTKHSKSLYIDVPKKMLCEILVNRQ